MTPLLLAFVVMAAEGYFLPPLQPAAQPPALRGQAQGNEYYPEFNKIEENLNYNNRFLYQSPNYHHFSDRQRYYSQAAAQQAYGPPHLQQLYQQPEQMTEPVYSDVRDSPIYIQPHDEETTRQQTLTITPQYLNLPDQSPNALSQYPAQQIQANQFYGQQLQPNQFSGQQLQANQYPAQQLQANQYTAQQLQANQYPAQQLQANQYHAQQLQGNLRDSQGIQGLQTTAQTTIPVLVKVSENQSLIVPVRAVYALPGFLERLVQRVQGYYSVYNPIDNLVVDRPYYVQTNGGVGDAGAPIQPMEIASNADSAALPVKADLVQEPSQGPSESAEVSAPAVDTAAVDTKIGDLKQDEIKDETTTVSQEEEEKEDTTELSTEEPKESSEKEEDSATEASESSDATTIPPSPSTEDPPSSTEVPFTSPASTSEEVSTTTKPEEKPQEAVSAEDNSATSDLESAGYTYYRPAIPFYYPPN